MTQTELAQIARLRGDFPNWVLFADSYGVTGRRRKDHQVQSFTGRSPAVLRSHLADAEFGDILGEVLARSA